MDYLKQLVSDLQVVNRYYKEISKLEFFSEKEHKDDNDGFRKRIVKAGASIVSLYLEIFLPKYSKIKDPVIQRAGNCLLKFSDLALDCLQDGRYCQITSILAKTGDTTKSPNNLDRLVDRLNKQVVKKEGINK